MFLTVFLYISLNLLHRNARIDQYEFSSLLLNTAVVGTFDMMEANVPALPFSCTCISLLGSLCLPS